jgi:hypothetical protein
MPTIHRLEADDPSIGGVLVTFDDEDHTSKVASWSSRDEVDVEQTSRQVVEGLIEALRDQSDLLNSTNWVSVTACVCKHVSDGNMDRES